MQLLQKASTRKRRPAVSASACAKAVLEGVPPVMRFIRQDVRQRRAPGLSVPQFRAMLFLRRSPGGTLSAVAEHLGLTAPTVSRMVDGLVNRNLVVRKAASGDRRHVNLALTAGGLATLGGAIAATQKQLAVRMETLAPAQLETIVEAMRILHETFDPQDTPST